MSSGSFIEVEEDPAGPSGAESPPPERSSVKYSCNTLWSIDNLNEILSTPGQDYFSPSFAPPNKVNYRWFIGLSVSERDGEKNTNIFLKPDFLRSVQGCRGCVFNYTLSVNRIDHTSIGVWHVESNTTSEQTRTYHTLRNPECSASSMECNALEIRADITFELLYLENRANWSFLMGSTSRVLRDLSGMLGSETFSDVTISVDEAGENIIIPAHQVILGARSTFFREKLTQDTPESRNRCIHITGSDVTSVRNMLAYMYTDRFDRNLETDQVVKLLKFAEIYSIEGLKTLCELHLIRGLNNANVFECLIAAESCNAQELKTRSLELICQTGQNMVRLRQALTANPDLTNEQRLSLLMDIVIEVSRRAN